MAGPQLPKLATRVRFPSSAPKNSCKIVWFCNYFSFFERFCSSAEFENVTLWEADSVTFMYIAGSIVPVKYWERMGKRPRRITRALGERIQLFNGSRSGWSLRQRLHSSSCTW